MSLFDELRHRRIPQTMVGYVVGLWGGAQVIDFVEQRYALSPHWVEIFVLGYLLLLPAVLAAAWTKGAPGPQSWTRGGLIAIGINVIVAGTVLTVGAQRFDLGPVTRTVVVENEEGETVEREVPRAAFRRTLTLSFPVAQAMDPEARDAAIDLEYLIETDLSQHPFLDLRSAWTENARAQRAGLDDPTRMPRALVHEAARNHDADVFLVGRVAPAETGQRYDLELVATDDGRPVASKSFEGADVFALADAISAWVIESVELPSVDVEDRPVADVTTESPEALREATRGLAALHFAAEFTAAAEHFERATAIDPTFASAHLGAYQTNLLLGRMDRALPAIDAAVQHAYRLTERGQFLARASYYGARNDADKALAVLEMWATVLPDDPTALRLLALNYGMTRDVERAVESIDRLLELAPNDVSALETVVDVASGQIDRPEIAIRAARRWTELTPSETAPWIALASAQRDAGDVEAAAVTLERALLLDPTSAEGRLLEASVAARTGDFERAIAIHEEFTDPSRPAADRTESFGQWMALERRRGRIDAALERLAEWEEVARTVMPPGQFAILLGNRLDLYVDDGRPEVARERFEQLRAGMPPPLNDLLAMSALEIALAIDDTLSARTELARFDQVVEELNVHVLRPELQVRRTRERLLAGDPAGALAAADEGLELDPSLFVIGRHRAAALHALGRSDEALEAVEFQLRADPAHPWALRDRAKILADLGRRDDAIAGYEAALLVWKDADPDHRETIETRRALDALRQES